METIPLTITSKRIKCLRRNLSEKSKDLYSKNYKTLIKKIEDDIIRWKDIPSSQLGRNNIVKMTILPKAVYKFTVIPIKLQIIFHRTRTKIFKFVWKHKRPLERPK